MKQLAVALGIVALGAIGTHFYPEIHSAITARLVQPQLEYQWKILTTAQVESGAIVPANTHVVFHLPSTFTKITRETLLGFKGKTVRYWGYCFAVNDTPEVVATRSGFPGLLFLSEKERAVRAAEAKRREQIFSLSNLPTEEDLQALESRPMTPLRHQLEVFKPSSMCYIMTEKPLAIGLDPDVDRLNNRLEKEISTDPYTPDGDGDGILDGVEYFTQTNPLIRDTDGDGLIDGIEDSDWDGRIDKEETDPRVVDSDRDTLCDGMCRVKLKQVYYYIGEDKNLNGIVDDGELNPNKIDTDEDGYSDDIEYYQCLAEGNTECP